MYKVVIADDEQIECKALEMMIQNGMADCEVLESVYNGIDLLKAVEEWGPDIAIVDINMPGLKGLDAIEIIRMKNKDLKVIINTAYSEFAYLKKAIQCDVVEYILKPVKREELYTVLHKTIDQLEEERKIREKNLRMGRIEGQMVEMAKNQFMSGLLLGELDQESFSIFLDSLNLRFFGGAVVLIRLAEYKDRIEEEALLREVQPIFHRELSRSTEFMEKYYNGGLYYLLVSGTGQEEFYEWFSKTAAILSGKVKEAVGADLLVAVSQWKTSPEGFLKGVRECRNRLQGRCTPGTYLSTEERKASPFLYETEFEQIRGLFRSGEWGKLEERFLLQLKKARNRKLSLEVFKVNTVLCLVKLFNSPDDNPWIGTGAALTRWGEWMAYDSYEKLELALGRLREAKNSKEYQEKGPYIVSALVFMKKEYTKDLSLEETARQSGITPFYLSRLFRQELNRNFTEVLTDIRMGKALEMLWEEEFSIREVSSKTGFTSLSYFYKVFKKYYGITAGELRALGERDWEAKYNQKEQKKT